jgi:hypothetical protein
MAAGLFDAKPWSEVAWIPAGLAALKKHFSVVPATNGELEPFSLCDVVHTAEVL